MLSDNLQGLLQVAKVVYKRPKQQKTGCKKLSAFHSCVFAKIQLKMAKLASVIFFTHFCCDTVTLQYFLLSNFYSKYPREMFKFDKNSCPGPHIQCFGTISGLFQKYLTSAQFALFQKFRKTIKYLNKGNVLAKSEISHVKEEYFLVQEQLALFISSLSIIYAGLLLIGQKTCPRLLSQRTL